MDSRNRHCDKDLGDIANSLLYFTLSSLHVAYLYEQYTELHGQLRGDIGRMQIVRVNCFEFIEMVHMEYMRSACS